MRSRRPRASGSATCRSSWRRRQAPEVHTPDGFSPGHVLPGLLPEAALAFAFRDAQLLVGGASDAPVVPVLAQLESLGLTGSTHYLGELGAVPCIAVALADDAPEPSGWRYAGLRSLFFALPEPLLAIAARAFQIVDWDRTHRYCGRCGTPTREKPGERAKECPACGHVAFPRVSPAMMVLVTRGRELLLARAHRFPAAMYSALAGFVEPGETIEDCIHREVREEVGVEVGGICLLREPVLGIPAFADDRLHRRVRRRRARPRRDRDRRSALVRLRRDARSSAKRVHRAPTDRGHGRAPHRPIRRDPDRMAGRLTTVDRPRFPRQASGKPRRSLRHLRCLFRSAPWSSC